MHRLDMPPRFADVLLTHGLTACSKPRRLRLLWNSCTRTTKSCKRFVYQLYYKPPANRLKFADFEFLFPIQRPKIDGEPADTGMKSDLVALTYFGVYTSLQVL